MRLLIIDKTAGLPSAHERHQALACLPNLEIHVFGPSRWVENDRAVSWVDHGDERYVPHRGTVCFPGYYARHFYSGGLVRVLRNVKPEVVQLLEEPWALVSGETAFLRTFVGSFDLLFYTWENLYRPWKYPSRLSPVYARIDRWLHRISVGAICATGMAETVLRRKGYDKPTAVIPYGVSARYFQSPVIRKDPGRPFTVGYIGRMLEMKGVDILIRAMDRLPDAELTLIGSGADESIFRSLASQCHVENRVRWISSIPEEEVVNHLVSFNLLVLPSRTMPGWSEQLGRVLIEAMALGIPAFGSSSGAIPEVLGREDLLFPEDDVDALVGAIRRLREDAVWRTEIVEYGQRRARELFSWERFAANMGDFYRNLGFF